MKDRGWAVLYWLLVGALIIRSVMYWVKLQELTGAPWWSWIGSR